jgi:ligand-binding sensor domain-containing protein
VGLVVVFWILLQFSGQAASFPQYSSRVWQMESGLPHDSVNCICQTTDGYLWVGTRRGLARFDGVIFDIPDSAEVPSLRTATVWALCQTRDGSLWIGTGREGLMRLRDGRFSVYTKAQGLVGDSVQVLYEARDGALWIGTTEGLSCWRNGTFRNFTRADGLQDTSVRSIAEDRQGNLWVLTPLGLSRIRDHQVFACPHWIGGVPRAILCEDNGDLWFGATQIGAARFIGNNYTLFCPTICSPPSTGIGKGACGWAPLAGSVASAAVTMSTKSPAMVAAWPP